MSKVKYVLCSLNVILFVGLTAVFVPMYSEAIAISDAEQLSKAMCAHKGDV